MLEWVRQLFRDPKTHKSTHTKTTVVPNKCTLDPMHLEKPTETMLHQNASRSICCIQIVLSGFGIFARGKRHNLSHSSTMSRLTAGDCGEGLRMPDSFRMLVRNERKKLSVVEKPDFIQSHLSRETERCRRDTRNLFCVAFTSVSAKSGWLKNPRPLS